MQFTRQVSLFRQLTEERTRGANEDKLGVQKIKIQV